MRASTSSNPPITPVLVVWVLLALISSRLEGAAPGTTLWSQQFKRSLIGPVLGNHDRLYLITVPDWSTEPATSKPTLLALTESGEVVWEIPLENRYYGGLTVDPKGWVYVSSTTLVAYDPDGNLRFRFAPFVTGPESSPSLSLPAIGSDGSLYVTASTYYNVSTNLVLLARILPTGNVAWTRSLIEVSDWRLGRISVSTPTLDGNNRVFVFVGLGGNIPGLFVLNSSGSTEWVYQSLDITTAQDNLAIGKDDTVFICERPSTRDLVPVLSSLKGFPINPFGERDWWILGSLNGGRQLIPEIAIGPEGTLYWSTAHGMEAVAPDGRRVWEYSTLWSIQSPAAVGHNGTIYFRDKKRLNAVNRIGRLLWSVPMESYYEQCPVLSKSGTLFLLRQDFSASQRRQIDAIATGVTSTFHPWPLPRGDVRNSGRSPAQAPGTGFTRSRALADGSMEMIIDGPPSHTYAIEQSVDLEHWQFAGNKASSNGVVRLVAGTSSATPNRFFRIAPAKAAGGE